jgi:hypothetical protein
LDPRKGGAMQSLRSFDVLVQWRISNVTYLHQQLAEPLVLTVAENRVKKVGRSFFFAKSFLSEDV